MTVEDLIQELNLTFPNSNQIIQRHQRSNKSFDKDKAIEYRNRNLIQFNYLLVPFNNQIEHLVYNTNVSSIGIGVINFFSKMKTLDESLKAFGSLNDFYKICLTPQSEIVSFAEESSEIELWSTSIDQFLDFLYIYERFDKCFIYGGDLPKDEFNLKLKVLISKGLSPSLVDELITKGLENKAE